MSGTSRLFQSTSLSMPRQVNRGDNKTKASLLRRDARLEGRKGVWRRRIDVVISVREEEKQEMGKERREGVLILLPPPAHFVLQAKG